MCIYVYGYMCVWINILFSFLWLDDLNYVETCLFFLIDYSVKEKNSITMLINILGRRVIITSKNFYWGYLYFNLLSWNPSTFQKSLEKLQRWPRYNHKFPALWSWWSMYAKPFVWNRRYALGFHSSSRVGLL